MYINLTDSIDFIKLSYLFDQKVYYFIIYHIFSLIFLCLDDFDRRFEKDTSSRSEI